MFFSTRVIKLSVCVAVWVVQVDRADSFKCGEKEFRETRNNYERCATNKIRPVSSVLAWGLLYFVNT